MPKKMSARAMLKAKKKKEEEERLAAAAGGGDASPSTEAATPSSGAGDKSGGNSELADAARAAIDAATGSSASGGGSMTAADIQERMKKAMDAREKIAETALLGEEMHRKLMDEAMSKVNVTITATKEQREGERDIHVQGLSVTLGPKVLLKDSDLTLSHGNRYGLIGRNGCGKSILMTILGRRQVPIPKHIDSYHLVSEIDPTDMTAIEAVLAVDVEKKELEAEAEILTNAIGDGDDSEDTINKLDEVYERLDELSAETAEKRAASILHGLGFTKAMQMKTTRDFSGGWRMRISLARALFLNPTLLILDEPTNHLDMEAVVWLEEYLAKFKKILLLVSHSQDFLNTVTTHTIHFNQEHLVVYATNYDGFIAAREDKEMHQAKRHEWEQAQIKKMKDYIAKFGHGTKKMARQAQSKEKTLAKMTRDGLTEAVQKERLIQMKFPDPDKIPPPVLQMQNVSFGYTPDNLLFKDVDFGVDLDSRVALVGPNGAGKSTLLKLMSGELTPNKGAVRPHPHLRMSRYTQHFVDTLDLEVTPLTFFCSLRPEESETNMRRYLGRFGVGGSMQSETMKYLSDGIKSRVVFAMLALQNPHIILFDEPTNHLDMESIDSLAMAIKDFGGGVVLVSHDMRLISQVAEEIWECDAGTIEMFPADIGDYKKRLRARIEKAQLAFESGEVAGDGVSAAQARTDAGKAATGGGGSPAPKAAKAPSPAAAAAPVKTAPSTATSGERESKESASKPAAAAAQPAVGAGAFRIGGGVPVEKKRPEAVSGWR